MSKSSKEELTLFRFAKFAIDQKVQEKVATLKKGSFDLKKIYQKCEADFFAELQVQVEKTLMDAAPFFPLLQEDNQQFFDKLTAPIKKNQDLIKSRLNDPNSWGDLKDLIVISPEDYEELNRLGEKWFNVKNYDKALLYFIFLTLQQPKNTDYWLAKGLSQQNLKRYKDALISYLMIIQIDPTQLLAYLQVVECLILDNNLDMAKQCFNEFLTTIDPKSYEGHEFVIDKINKIKENLVRNELQAFYKLLKNDNKKIYEKIISQSDSKLSEDDFKELYTLAETWFNQDCFDKAFLYFSFLSIWDKTNVVFELAKGMCMQNLDKRKEAITHYSIAIQLDPSNLLSYLQIMDCLLLENQIKEARQFYTIFMENTQPKDYATNAVILSKLKTIQKLLESSVA